MRFLAHVVIFFIFPIIGNILFAVLVPKKPEKIEVTVTNTNTTEGGN